MSSNARKVSPAATTSESPAQPEIVTVKAAAKRVSTKAAPPASAAPVTQELAPKTPRGTTRASRAKAAPAQAAEVAAVEPALAVVPELGADGKKLLPDLSDDQFEKDVVADPTIKDDEQQAFVVSAADETDEPEQQVMVAGATADPVKDYLKQIGKVPLLNAEMEVELAKRIEAGLFSEEKLAKGGKIGRAHV